MMPLPVMVKWVSVCLHEQGIISSLHETQGFYCLVPRLLGDLSVTRLSFVLLRTSCISYNSNQC